MTGIVCTLLGASGQLPALLTGHTVTDTAVGSPVQSAFNLTNAGVASYSTINSGSGNYSPEWINGGGAAASSYDVRWTNTSGSPSGGDSTGAWLNLGTNRSWNVNRASIGTTTCTGTVEIRNASTLVVITSASITITCTYS